MLKIPKTTYEVNKIFLPRFVTKMKKKYVKIITLKVIYCSVNSLEHTVNVNIIHNNNKIHRWALIKNICLLISSSMTYVVK